MQVYKLAKELGVGAMVFMDALRKTGMTVKSHMSHLSEEEEAIARDLYSPPEEISPVEKVTEMSDKGCVPATSTVASIDSFDEVVEEEEVFFSVEDQKKLDALVAMKKRQKPKRKPTEPWKASQILNIPDSIKDPAYVYRWCDKEKDGNIRKKENEGWVVDNELTKRAKKITPSAQYGSDTDSTMQVRELIVMRLPVERAQARKEYYANKTNQKLAAQKKEFETDVAIPNGEMTVERY